LSAAWSGACSFSTPTRWHLFPESAPLFPKMKNPGAAAPGFVFVGKVARFRRSARR
jgi:hypothetical protein